MPTYNEERRYLFGCAGKVQHKTLISAEYALKHDSIIETNSEIYECQFCGFMHIGTLWHVKSKTHVEKSKFQTKRQRKEMIFNKKKIRRKGR